MNVEGTTLALPRRGRWLTAVSHADAGQILAVSAIVGVALVLRLPYLDANLWLDEVWCVRILLDSSNLLQLLLRDVHPPLYSMFMFLWIGPFGDSEISVRLPSLLCGLLTIALTYRISLQVVGRQAAILASVLLALSPVHIWYSNEARAYMMLIFLIALALLAYLQIHSNPQRTIWLVIYGISLTSAVSMHFYAIVYVFIYSVWCIVDRHDRWRQVLAINTAAAGVLMMFAASTLLVARDFLIGSQYLSAYLRPFTAVEWWLLFFNWFLMGNAIWPILPSIATGVEPDPAKIAILIVIQLLACIVLVRGIVVLARQSSAGRLLIVQLLLLPACLFAATSVGVEHIYVERSLLVVLPFFFLVLATGATSFRPVGLARAGAGGLLLLSGVATGCFLASGEGWTVEHPKPHWRDAVAYLDAQARDANQDSPVFAATPADELIYYARRYEHASPRKSPIYKLNPQLKISTWLDLRYVGEADDPCALALADNATTFYVIKNRLWVDHINAVLDATFLDQRCQLREEERFNTIWVYKFSVADDPSVPPSPSATSARASSQLSQSGFAGFR